MVVNREETPEPHNHIQVYDYCDDFPAEEAMGKWRKVLEEVEASEFHSHYLQVYNHCTRVEDFAAEGATGEWHTDLL